MVKDRIPFFHLDFVLEGGLATPEADPGLALEGGFFSDARLVAGMTDGLGGKWRGEKRFKIRHVL